MFTNIAVLIVFIQKNFRNLNLINIKLTNLHKTYKASFNYFIQFIDIGNKYFHFNIILIIEFIDIFYNKFLYIIYINIYIKYIDTQCCYKRVMYY